jgi:isoleucyl-tRNA synthetase
VDDDKKAVYATTYEILKGVAQLAAPMAPFITDEIYTKLTGEESVHLSLYPAADKSLIDDALEEKMDIVRSIVSLGRGIREKERIKVRQPLLAALVDVKYKALIADMEGLIKEELNIKDVRYESDLEEYIDYNVKPDFKAAGPKLGARMKDFASSIARADAVDLLGALEGGEPVIWSLQEARPSQGSADLLAEDEIVIEKDFIAVQINAREGFAVAMEDGVFTILDTTLTPALVSEGLMREFVSKVQQLRKQTGLEMMDNIDIRYGGDSDVADAVNEYRDYIMKETLARELTRISDNYPDEYDINGHKTGIDIMKV